jgi:hypothetical protein
MPGFDSQQKGNIFLFISLYRMALAAFSSLASIEQISMKLGTHLMPRLRLNVASLSGYDASPLMLQQDQCHSFFADNARFSLFLSVLPCVTM